MYSDSKYTKIQKYNECDSFKWSHDARVRTITRLGIYLQIKEKGVTALLRLNGFRALRYEFVLKLFILESQNILLQIIET